MIKKIFITSLLILLLFSCKSQQVQKNDNITNDNTSRDNITVEINDNITDNKSYDNSSMESNNLNETVIDVYINAAGEKITKIYKINSSDITENPENQEIIQKLSEYNNNECISWIVSALKYHNINDNLADTYITYKDIYLYEPVVLHIALICSSADVFNMLIDYGADVFAGDNNGETVNSLAKKLNNAEIIEIIAKEYENEF